MMKFTFTKANRTTIFDKLSALDWGGLSQFLDGWKDGTNGYLEVKRERKPKSPQQLAFYYAVIIPHAIQATVEIRGHKIDLELTIKNMDDMLKMRYAALTGKYVTKTEMSMEECSAYESWCIGWIKQWLDYDVPAADKNWNK
jgi:hypothetical protein